MRKPRGLRPMYHYVDISKMSRPMQDYDNILSSCSSPPYGILSSLLFSHSTHSLTQQGMKFKDPKIKESVYEQINISLYSSSGGLTWIEGAPKWSPYWVYEERGKRKMKDGKRRDIREEGGRRKEKLTQI